MKKKLLLIEGYTPLTIEEIKALAKEGAGKSAEIVVKSHLSLTGASGKVGLYYDEASGKWYKAQGLAPSTHIVKQSHVRYKNIVLNEQLCLLAAQKMGIEIPESFILQAQAGKVNDEDVLFATRRFDRDFDKDSRIIDGLKTPYRLWKRVVYNCFIGNTDNHIKNSSLIYSKDLSAIRLAPFYDVICTKVYESSTDEMSVSINGKQNINQITRDDLEQEAKNCGLGPKAAMKIYDEVHNGIQKALLASADGIITSGIYRSTASLWQKKYLDT